MNQTEWVTCELARKYLMGHGQVNEFNPISYLKYPRFTIVFMSWVQKGTSSNPCPYIRQRQILTDFPNSFTDRPTLNRKFCKRRQNRTKTYCTVQSSSRNAKGAPYIYTLALQTRRAIFRGESVIYWKPGKGCAELTWLHRIRETRRDAAFCSRLNAVVHLAICCCDLWAIIQRNTSNFWWNMGGMAVLAEN